MMHIQKAQELSDSLEVDSRGRLTTSLRESYLETQVAGELYRILRRGTVIYRCALLMRDRIRRPGLAWLSPEFFQRNGLRAPYHEMPAICVEFIDGITKETLHMVDSYFRHSAREVWLCDNKGRLSFYVDGILNERSRIVPTFPTLIESS